MIASAARRTSAAVVAAAIALGVAAVLLFWELGRDGLRGDEGFYGIVVSELITANDKSRLTLEGRPFSNKPPLAFWAMAASSTALGLDESTLRLPAALVSWSVALLVFGVARRRCGEWGAVAAVVGFVSVRHALYYHGWRAAVTEPLLTLFELLSLVAYARLRARRERTVALVALSVLGGLTKGPVGAVVVAAALLTTERFAFARRGESSPAGPPQRLGALRILGATIVPSLLAYLAWWLWNVPSLEALSRFVSHDWFARAVGELQESHVQPWHYFFVHLWGAFGGWLVLLPLAMRPAVFAALRAKGDVEGILLRVFPPVTLFLFSLPVSKIAWYTYPAYPVLAIVLAEQAVALATAPRFPLFARRLAAAGALAALGWRAVDAFRGLPRASPRSLVSLAKFVEKHPEAVVRYDERLRREEFRPREWNRFTLYSRLRATPLRAGESLSEAGCLFVVTPEPDSWGASSETRTVIEVASQARSRPEPRLAVIDLCQGAWSRTAGEVGAAKAPQEAP